MALPGPAVLHVGGPKMEDGGCPSGRMPIGRPPGTW